jgi:hypothetical protein
LLVEHTDRGKAERIPIARSPAQLAFEKLGGEKLIGVDVRSEADLIQVLDRGIPLDALSELTKGSLSAEEVERLIIPRRTLSHRKARSQSLSRGESERALRVASILAQAEQTLPTKRRRIPGCAGQPRRSAADARSISWTARPGASGGAAALQNWPRYRRLMILWRLTRRAHADLRGRGGELADGRWHTRGRPIVYGASTAALAALEVRVHLICRSICCRTTMC